MENYISLPKKLLKRLVQYQFYLKQLVQKQRDYISNERLAADLGYGINEVREDLFQLDGALLLGEIHQVKWLLRLIEEALGYDRENAAILVGVGNLGKAMLNYNGFKNCGLSIVASFDSDERLAGQEFGGVQVFQLNELENLVSRLNVQAGIITTPTGPAQAIASRMVQSGICGIWNFAPTILQCPGHVVVQNTSIYNDFFKLTNKLKEAQKQNEG